MLAWRGHSYLPGLAAFHRQAPLALPQQAFLANPDLGNWAVLAPPYLSFLLELTLSSRKQDRNHHIWASGGNGRQAAPLTGKDETVPAPQGGHWLCERRWRSRDGMAPWCAQGEWWCVNGFILWSLLRPAMLVFPGRMAEAGRAALLRPSTQRG